MVKQRAKVGDRCRRVWSDLTEGRAGAEPDPVIQITERVDENRYRHARQRLSLAVGITDARHDVIGGTVRPTELAEEIARRKPDITGLYFRTYRRRSWCGGERILLTKPPDS
jgi:hypothetical protein